MTAVKLSDMMKKRQLLSFELFPPKTDRGMANLSETIQQLCRYKPEYISVTYGAGGGNVGANRQVCRMVRNAGTVPAVSYTHLDVYKRQGRYAPPQQKACSACGK